MPTFRRCLMLVVSLAACSDPVVTTVEAIDVAPDVQPVDAQPEEVSVSDVQIPDIDVAKDVKDAQSDIASPLVDTGDNGCSQILAQIAALKPKLTPCGAGETCQMFEYPICDTMGCFQTPYASNADVAALQNLAAAAGAAQCPGFHCGCGPYAPAFCLNSQCQQCPPNCDGTCEELTAAVLASAHTANWCSGDADCTILSTGLCPVGDLPCGGTYVNKYNKSGDLQVVLTAYSKVCGPSMCKCVQPSTPKCVKGKCVAS